MIRKARSYGSAEEKQATQSARLTTAVLIVLGIAAFFSPLKTELFIAQKAATNVLPVPKLVDQLTEPFIKEREWKVMTLPASSWVVTLEEPVRKPLAETPKPVERPKEKPPEITKKPQPKPRPPQKMAVGSAKMAAATTGSSENVSAMNQAFRAIVEQIERHKRYPTRARKIGLTGNAVLEVTVNSQGVVSGYRIKSTSNALFKQSTLQAAKHLDGFKTGADRAAVIEVPVVYRLE